MVSGADTLLDIIAQGKNSVEVAAQLTPFEGATELKLTRKGVPEGGGYYHIKKWSDQQLDLDLWLCEVVEFVFETVPDTIYIKSEAT